MLVAFFVEADVLEYFENTLTSTLEKSIVCNSSVYFGVRQVNSFSLIWGES